MKKEIKTLSFNRSAGLKPHKLTIFLKRCLLTCAERSRSIIPLFLALFVSACVEEVVTIDDAPSLDSARYNWEIDTIPNFVSRVWAEDTVNIFYLIEYGFIYYNGENYSYHNFGNDLNVISMGGYNRYNIYFGGHDLTQINQGKPRLQKWDGAALQEIPVPDSINKKSPIRTIHLQSANEIWLGIDSGKIVKYDGINNFTFYSIDSSFMIFYFLKDENNELYFMAYKDSFNIGHTEGKVWTDIYKLQADGWMKIYSKTYSNVRPILPAQIGNQIYGYDRHNIYKFVNNDFSKIIEIHSNMIVTSDLCGSSKTDLFLGGTLYPGPSVYNFNAFHWNGVKWSVEFTAFFRYPFLVKKINEKYFCFCDDIEFLGTTYIYVGTLK